MVKEITKIIVKNCIKPSEHLSIIDVGCGTCFNLDYLKDFGIPMGLFIFSEKYKRNEGKLEYYSLSWMFLMALAAWFITPYTKEYEVIYDLFNLLYIILLEGVFFELFPLTYLPGKAIYKWSRFAWASIFTAVSFLLLHTLFNPNSAFSTISESNPTKNTIIILGIFVLASFLVWGVAKLTLKTKQA